MEDETRILKQLDERCLGRMRACCLRLCRVPACASVRGDCGWWSAPTRTDCLSLSRFFFVVATALSLELGAHTYGAQQSTPAEHGADPGVDRVVQVPRRERWRDCNVDREAVSKPRARGTDERGDGRKGGQTEGSLRSEHDAHRALQ